MRFEEFNMLNIKRTGFILGVFRFNRLMKNVKPEFKGIRETFSRGLIGFYNTKERIVIHLVFFMWTIEK